MGFRAFCATKNLTTFFWDFLRFFFFFFQIGLNVLFIIHEILNFECTTTRGLIISSQLCSKFHPFIKKINCTHSSTSRSITNAVAWSPAKSTWPAEFHRESISTNILTPHRGERKFRLIAVSQPEGSPNRREKKRFFPRSRTWPPSKRQPPTPHRTLTLLKQTTRGPGGWGTVPSDVVRWWWVCTEDPMTSFEMWISFFFFFYSFSSHFLIDATTERRHAEIGIALSPHPSFSLFPSCDVLAKSLLRLFNLLGVEGEGRILFLCWPLWLTTISDFRKRA